MKENKYKQELSEILSKVAKRGYLTESNIDAPGIPLPEEVDQITKLSLKYAEGAVGKDSVYHAVSVVNEGWLRVEEDKSIRNDLRKQIKVKLKEVFGE